MLQDLAVCHVDVKWNAMHLPVALVFQRLGAIPPDAILSSHRKVYDKRSKSCIIKISIISMHLEIMQVIVSTKPNDLYRKDNDSR